MSTLIAPQTRGAFSWIRIDDLKGATATSEQRLALALIVFYYLSALLFYSVCVGWGTLDTVYFATVTFTTVGYGDIAPKTSAEKLFTCLFALLAVAIIATALGLLMQTVVDKETQKLQSSEGTEIGCPFETLASALGRAFAVLGIGSGVYGLLEGQSFIDSLYWGCMTVTTIGYGDVVPTTSSGKLFAVVFMTAGTAFFGQVLSAVVQFPLDLRRKRLEDRVHRQLGDDLQTAELTALVNEVHRLGLAVDESQGHCTRSDFAIAMLVSVGKLNEHDLRKALHQFDKLDVQRDFQLDVRDLRE